MSPAPGFEAVVVALRAAGCVYAEEEARLILGTVEAARIEEIVARRVAGEPLEPLLGWVDFAGHRLALEPGVFVPRQKSAFLVDLALGHLDRLSGEPRSAGGPVVLDLCCGCGALGRAVELARPEAVVHGAEIDPIAVRNARRNLARVHQGDLFDAVPHSLLGRVDVVLCNAPYVPSDRIGDMPPEARDHEPSTALDGGSDGLDVHRRIAAEVGDWLAPGGVHLVEVHRSQVETAREMFARHTLRTTIEYDETRDVTALVAERAQLVGS